MDKQVCLLVGTVKGVFCFWSDLERRDWRMTGPHLAGWEVYSVLGDGRSANGEKSGHRIFAGTHHQSGGATIQVSEDYGATWMPVEKGPAFPSQGEFDYDALAWVPKHPGPQREWLLKRIWQLVPGHPSDPGTYYAGTEEAGLFVSRDGGSVWEELSALTSHPTRPGWMPGAGGMGLHTILIHPQDPRRMWVAASAVGVFRTDDAGESWKTCHKGLARVPTGDPIPEVGY